ncbi:F-box only protein 47 [Amia ocellicauda]|uniref:F-box only protein 47 n=1 Tax=Amia ocellicauda TaxID=2972642 RepID=UPI00346421F0
MASRSFTLIPAHKYRRSGRKQGPSIGAARRQRRSTWGRFEKIPAEVLDMILRHLTVKEMSVFSMVSKAVGAYVVRQVSTLAWRSRMFVQEFHPARPSSQEDCILEHYKCLGLLFKRCTLLLPTKDRLKFIYGNFSQVPCVVLERCAVHPVCLGFASFGAFLQTLIAGWDELECHRVFNSLCEFTNLPRKIQTAVASKPGASEKLEGQIRLFCRSVLLDPWLSRRDTLFWLTRILKPWPMVNQARLLFIFYGPLTLDGRIGWQSLCDTVVAECSLWDLAKALKLLYNDPETKEWTTDSVISLIEELTVLPGEWLQENVARLLILCGNRTCFTFMASRALNGRVAEIARLLVFLILVCEKDGYCMNWSVKMMQQISRVFPGSPERWSFVQSVENVFSQVTMQMYESLMAGGREAEADTFQNLCSILNASAHFHTEMVYMIIKGD